MDDSTFFSKEFHRNCDVDLSLRGAKAASSVDELGAWLQVYLSAEPRWANPGLATGLLKFPRVYTLFEVDPDELVRKSGPEPEMEYRQDGKSFDAHIQAIAESLIAVEDLPPLVVEEVRGRYVVCDGTHRLEAIRSKGWPTCWVILFADA
jgi:ParB/Sulfiredoxin domain